jgi:hypothetical protein
MELPDKKKGQKRFTIGCVNHSSPERLIHSHFLSLGTLAQKKLSGIFEQSPGEWSSGRQSTIAMIVDF